MPTLSPPLSLLENRALTIDEAADALRVSRATIYVMMRENDLRYFELGSRRRIPGAEIVRLLGGAS